MPLRNDVDDLALAVATEIKRNRTWINGNTAGLDALATANKTNLVAAINEVNDSVGSAAGIDDNTTSTSSTWSSQKTSDTIGEAVAALPTPSSIIDDVTPSAGTVYSSTKTDQQISAAVGAVDLTDLIDDAAPATTTVFSGTETAGRIQAAKDEILGGAGAAYDTLAELQALMEGDDTQTTGILDALGLRVRVDAAQAFDATQQGQARANIGAVSATQYTSDIGDLTGFDPVATFEAGLLA